MSSESAVHTAVHAGANRSGPVWRTLGAGMEGAVRAWCLVVFALGIGGNLLADDPLRWPVAIAVAAAACALVAVRPVVARVGPPGDMRADAWGWAALLAIVLASLGWAVRFDSMQVSDFGVYYRCGTEPHGTLSAWIAACQSHYLHPNLVYWLRTLLYTTPFGLAFGANYPALKLYNVVLHAATLGVLFAGLRETWGRAAALVGIVALGCYPEWWFTLTLASTDNAALLCIVAFLLGLPRLATSARPAGWVTMVAGAMFAAQQLRTVGPVLLVGLAGWTAWAMHEVPHRRWSLLRRAALAAALYWAADHVLLRMVTTPGIEPVSLLKVLSALQLSSGQDFTVGYAWAEHLWRAVPPDWRERVALHKLLGEFVSGFASYPAYLLRKATVFFSGAGYQAFAAADLVSNPDTVRTVPASTVSLPASRAAWPAAVVGLQLCLAAWTLWTRRLDLLSAAALYVLAALLLVIVGLGEVQPRYSVLVAPCLAVLAAAAITPRRCRMPTHRGPSGLLHLADPPGRVVLGAAMLLAFYLVGTAAAWTLAVRRPSALSTAVQVAPAMIDGRRCNDQPARLALAGQRLEVSLPPGAACASIEFRLPPDARHVMFFVARDRLPFPFEPRVSHGSRYRVVGPSGALLHDGTLGYDTAKWLRLPLGQPSASSVVRRLTIELLAEPTAVASRPLDIWLMQVD